LSYRIADPSNIGAGRDHYVGWILGGRAVGRHRTFDSDCFSHRLHRDFFRAHSSRKVTGTLVGLAEVTPY
jgi:hypothetical protein